MSNAVGRLLGTLGSGVLYTYAGAQRGPYAGSDARRGLGVCFIAGTVASLLAALITIRIRDEAAGLRCGPCVCVRATEQMEPAPGQKKAEPEAPSSEDAAKQCEPEKCQQVATAGVGESQTEAQSAAASSDKSGDGV